MQKAALFAFNGDPMCFIHVLLNAINMNDKGQEVRLIIEGAATRLIPELAREDNTLFQLYERAKTLGLVEGVCRACATKMGTIEAAKAQGLKPLDDMNGHPGMARYREAGFDVITF